MIDRSPGAVLAFLLLGFAALPSLADPEHTVTPLLLTIALVALAALFSRYHAASGRVILVVLGFGAVVLFHEVGHFVAAKACGIQVDAFSIFWLPTRVCSSSWASS
jgi:hypothetical protein